MPATLKVIEHRQNKYVCPCCNCDLVDATGRIILTDKKGHIPNDLLPILQRLNLSSNTWLDELNQFKIKGHTAVGTIQQLQDFCKSLKKKWRSGIQLEPALE